MPPKKPSLRDNWYEDLAVAVGVGGIGDDVAVNDAVNVGVSV